MASGTSKISTTSARGRDWQIHRASPAPWDPSTGSANAPIPDQWLDGADTTTIDKAGPLPITNGATVVEWRTKAGTARKYKTFGTAGPPTWDSNVVGSLGGVKCNHQTLSADVLTGMRGLSGRTMLCAFKQITNEHSATKGIGFGVTEPHVSANANNPTNTVAAATGGFGGGTRRIQGEAIVNTATLLANNTTVRPVADGEVFVVTMAVDYSGGRHTVYANGCGAPQFAATLTSSGTTNGAIDPYAMTVGGYIEETGALGANTGDGLCIAYILEILDWFSLLSADRLVEPHDYMCRRWGSGAM